MYELIQSSQHPYDAGAFITLCFQYDFMKQSNHGHQLLLTITVEFIRNVNASYHNIKSILITYQKSTIFTIK